MRDPQLQTAGARDTGSGGCGGSSVELDRVTLPSLPQKVPFFKASQDESHQGRVSIQPSRLVGVGGKTLPNVDPK